MPKRFEIVAPPVEERLQSGLIQQLEATVNTANSLFYGLQNKTTTLRNSTSTLLSDQDLVHHISTTAIQLLSPTSLPGALFTIALVLHILHHLLVNKLARRMLAKQQEALQASKHD